MRCEALAANGKGASEVLTRKDDAARSKAGKKSTQATVGGAVAGSAAIAHFGMGAATIAILIFVAVLAGASSPATSAVIDTVPGTDVRTFGAKGDGVTDDTVALQNAANSNQVLWFPKTSAFYKTTSVITLKNSVYSNGAEVRILQDASPGKSVFRVADSAAQLTIDGFVLNGLYTTGSNANEYSHGISLWSSANVTISNNTIKNSFGDNIYLGRASSAPCRNITINNNILSNPYRNNISLIHTDGVTIRSNTITKTFDYVGSIDLEPNPDGVGNNKNVTIDNNNITCPHGCINVSKNNTDACTNLRITNNVISALANMIYISAASPVTPAPYFKGNHFTATNFSADLSHAGMFLINGSTNITFDSNVDHTTPGTGYHSLVLWGGANVAVNTNNTFVP